MMRVSLIISTYNSEECSGPATKQVINEFSENYPVPIQHIWHVDNGFQKTKILNCAIVAATGESTSAMKSGKRINYQGRD